MQARSVQSPATPTEERECVADAATELAEEARGTRARAREACERAAQVVAASQRARANRWAGTGGRLTGR